MPDPAPLMTAVRPETVVPCAMCLSSCAALRRPGTLARASARCADRPSAACRAAAEAGRSLAYHLVEHDVEVGRRAGERRVGREPEARRDDYLALAADVHARDALPPAVDRDVVFDSDFEHSSLVPGLFERRAGD